MRKMINCNNMYFCMNFNFSRAKKLSITHADSNLAGFGKENAFNFGKYES